MRPTLAISIGVLLLASLSCLFIVRRKEAAVQAQSALDHALA